jgi:serine/threonine protein kinase
MQPPPPQDHFRLVGTLLDDRIRVERVVARGGFGLVYQGFHTGLGHRVAVKVLCIGDECSPAVREDCYARFNQEAQLIYQLSHPAIVRVLDFGVSITPIGEKAPWMVLEWLDGTTLTQAIRARATVGPFAPEEALALLRPAIEALAFAHARSIAHRDVTPANLFLCPGPLGPQVRLIDFGIARVMETEDTPGTGNTATQSRMSAFSRAYAAPEQLGHTRTGPWTDVHALGLILSEMMTLRRPFEGADSAEVLAASMSPTRPTPAARGIDVGPFEAVLARSMLLRPGDRYASAAELLVALDAAERASGSSEGDATTDVDRPTEASPSFAVTEPRLREAVGASPARVSARPPRIQEPGTNPTYSSGVIERRILAGTAVLAGLYFAWWFSMQTPRSDRPLPGVSGPPEVRYIDGVSAPDQRDDAGGLRQMMLGIDEGQSSEPGVGDAAVSGARANPRDASVAQVLSPSPTPPQATNPQPSDALRSDASTVSNGARR